MGKGKAKGWKPSSVSSDSTLYGSADHLTGDSIASPVQLREEGRPIPRGHLNYNDDWRRGRFGKGASGGRSDAHGTGANTIVLGHRELAKAGPKEQLAPKLLVHTVPKSHAASVLTLATGFDHSTAITRQMKDEQTLGVNELCTVVREPAHTISQVSAGVSTQSFEEMRHSSDPVLVEMASADRFLATDAPPRTVIGNCRHETLNDQDNAKDDRTGPPMGIQCRREALFKNEASAGAVEITMPLAEPALQKEHRVVDSQKVLSSAETAMEAPDLKKQRQERSMDVVSVKDGHAIAGPVTTPGTAMQQGLQQWGQRVNALAKDDPNLMKSCREFVRKRILKAHATGNLHSINWDKEPLPTVENLSHGTM